MSLILSAADRALARLDGAALTLPNPELFVYAFMRQEAALSSQIEGTQASLEDLFEYEAVPEAAGAGSDVTEIINYIQAMNWGLDEINRLPLSKRLVRGLHERLLATGRGAARNPGNFRQGQNHIGTIGCSIEEATFVPPSVQLMHPALDNWEKYLHQRELPILVRCAIIHAQFETIHPFWDGNGRVGRMIITLKLCEEGILERPLLYLSLYFKQYRQEYYDRLQSVRDNGDWEGWIKFFLTGVRLTCKAALASARQITLLREELILKAQASSRSSNPARLTDALFRHPYITIPQAAKILDTTAQGGSNVVSNLVEIGILKETYKSGRMRVFAFRPYLDLLHQTSGDLSSSIGREDALRKPIGTEVSTPR
ncbi:cell division protein Fic [Aureimonas sp. SA4125]|uniref:Fic family protein n=1 Tax=Aureimonas sp. SA4125 TaxID=2826993 RepID=UPI001CC808A2|nr:Fic family protein [Aureimonas sp. SA4125]BDA86686.1 cell division protein Fic [Aureimonas sp. SA4125]